MARAIIEAFILIVFRQYICYAVCELHFEH
uniref:Uncharacterized protein n=1 Tax=Anguilla anguilla TaxID=7936 RepID=A0A0E9PY68_ANGAN